MLLTRLFAGDRLAARDAQLSEVISTFDSKMTACAAVIARQRAVCGDAADAAIGVAGCVGGSAAALGLRKQLAGAESEVASNAARIALKLAAWRDQHVFAAAAAAELRLSCSTGTQGDGFPEPSAVAEALAACDPHPGVSAYVAEGRAPDGAAGAAALAVDGLAGCLAAPRCAARAEAFAALRALREQRAREATDARASMAALWKEMGLSSIEEVRSSLFACLSQ